MNRYDDTLRTDAYGFALDEMHIGRMHIPNAAALDTDGVMTAKARATGSTTAWVASTCTLNSATAGDDLTVTAPVMLGAAPNALKIKLETNSTDVLAVSSAADTITIKLASTTAGNNTAAKIQAAIRALGKVNGVDVSGFVCAAAGDWDTTAIATGETEAVAMASGVTGDVDIITEGLKNPPQARNITATTDGTAGDIGAVAVTVHGTDIGDQVISEQLPYFTANNKTTVTGVKAFKTVTKVELPAHDGAAATTAIGFSDIFGLPIKMTDNMVRVAFGGAWEASAPTIVKDATEVCKNTIDIVGTPDGANDVDILILL